MYVDVPAHGTVSWADDSSRLALDKLLAQRRNVCAQGLIFTCGFFHTLLQLQNALILDGQALSVGLVKFGLQAMNLTGPSAGSPIPTRHSLSKLLVLFFQML